MLTLSEMSRGLGVDRKVVRRNQAAGMPMGSVAAAMAWRQEHVRVRASGNPPAAKPQHVHRAAPIKTAVVPPKVEAIPPAAATSGYADARARREKADAERAELETARMAGRLVDREAVERGVFDSFRALRDSVFAAAKTQARRVLGLTEVREIELVLEEELREAFGGWESKMLKKLHGPSS